jgi:hypothetical protein
MGTHQGDPLGGALFILLYFRALRFTVNRFPFLSSWIQDPLTT